MISVLTEINDASYPAQGWVLFDGDCQFCRSWARRMQPVLAPRGFAFTPLQTPWVRRYFHMPEEQLLSEMRVVLRNGERYGGADAIVALAKFVWWAWPLFGAAYIPGVRRLLHTLYRYIASGRYCSSGTCSLKTNSVAVLPPTDHRGASL
jgi:predicted DCC family thiol-disulfide oxidoreductase YuxK